MIRGRRLWRAGLAAGGGGCAALMLGLLSYAQDMTPRPPPTALTALPVPLDPARPARTSAGALDYAGGLVLSAGENSRFGGLSGLALGPDGKTVTTVSDEGQTARFEISLDPQGRLTGADNLMMAALHEGGVALGRIKQRGDAEDIAAAGGVFYVPLENDNRVLEMADPFDAAAPVRRMALPAEAYGLEEGKGLEALAAADIGGQTMLAFGAEDGRIWLCPPQAGDGPAGDCRRIVERPPAPLYRLTALAHLAGSEDFVALYRSLDPLRGWRARVQHLSPGPGGYKTIALATLASPMTVDNMEGVAVLPLPDGSGWRLYLLSDDNFRDVEHTLLLAFDWRRR